MLSTEEKQEIINHINEILTQVILRKAGLKYEREKWVNDCIDQNAFTWESEVPVNSRLNNKSNLIDAIHRDVISYKELFDKLLQKYTETVTYQNCIKDVQKYCNTLRERLQLYDQL